MRSRQGGSPEHASKGLLVASCALPHTAAGRQTAAVEDQIAHSDAEAHGKAAVPGTAVCDSNVVQAKQATAAGPLLYCTKAEAFATVVAPANRDQHQLHFK